MTANGNSAASPKSEVSVRVSPLLVVNMFEFQIRSSVYLLGNYEMKATQPGEVTPGFLTLVLSVKGQKNQDISLQLSFKHILRIDLLDNTDNEGAGMVIYMWASLFKV